MRIAQFTDPDAVIVDQQYFCSRIRQGQYKGLWLMKTERTLIGRFLTLEVAWEAANQFYQKQVAERKEMEVAFGRNASTSQVC